MDQAGTRPSTTGAEPRVVLYRGEVELTGDSSCVSCVSATSNRRCASSSAKCSLTYVTYEHEARWLLQCTDLMPTVHAKKENYCRNMLKKGSTVFFLSHLNPFLDSNTGHSRRASHHFSTLHHSPVNNIFLRLTSYFSFSSPSLGIYWHLHLCCIIVPSQTNAPIYKAQNYVRVM